ncbi:MAG: hypothetical protein H0T42_11205 [Deltaproteobacteria bacterium]|nr:hypothetical protein [Deltaproteobacteria bacterium]
MRRALICLLVLACGCSEDAPPPPRELVLETAVGAEGVSADVAFEIPEGTRSITIVVQGADDALYALGAFALGDQAELVHLPAGAPGPAMQMTYEQEQIGQLAGDLYQSIRLGTFTHVYPYRPDQNVIAGTGFLRVASNRSGPVTVRILMPEDDGANVLPLNLYVVSDTLADPNTPEFRSEVTRLFAQANVVVTFNGVERIPGTALERITDFSEPQEAPTSMSAMLPGLVADRMATGLDIFFVEGLPAGVGGLALGTPGPPIRGSYYFGVVVRGGFPAAELARITAHEAGHFLALQHVLNRGISGRTYPDPLDDTTPGADNLMEGGTLLTPHQAFALSRSALLITP